MKKALIAAALVFAPASLSAQSQQEQLDARYDRALAAGYKALFLCGAMANAERNGINRTPESVAEWELTGTYPRIQSIMDTLDFTILRDADRRLAQVEVRWAEDMPPRFAEASAKDGCRLAPIGLQPPMPETVASGGGAAANADEAPLLRPNILVVYNNLPLKDQLQDAFGETYGEGARTTAVMISHKGRIYSRHAHGFSPHTPQRTWSVAKSLAATIIGAAVQRGEADVNAAMVHNDWRWDARRAITIDDLLRMASGRYSDTPGNRTDPLYMGGSTVEETAAHWPLIHAPGTVFRYANNDTLMAVKAIENTFEDYAPADFLKDARMLHTVAETDWADEYILSSQVWATAPDLLKMGLLYLNDGVTPEGKRLLPEGWAEYVSRPSGPQPDGPFGYGAGFWLFNKSDGIPPDSFAAMGNRGQYVVIVPSRDIVIVRRGEDPTGSRFDIVSFTRDVLAGLGD